MTYRQRVRLERGKEATRLEVLNKTNHYKAVNDLSNEVIALYDKMLLKESNKDGAR